MEVSSQPCQPRLGAAARVVTCCSRQEAELSAQARGERTLRGAWVIYTRIIQPKSSGDFRNHWSRDLPKADFVPCNMSFSCFVFKIYGLSVDLGL